jgi:phage gp29-like protein
VGKKGSSSKRVLIDRGGIDVKRLVPRLERVMATFGGLSRQEQRQFANVMNAMFSDGGPTNPKLGNTSYQSRGADQRVPTSQFTNPSLDEADYFRQPANKKGNYKTEPDASMTPSRVTLSVRMRGNPIKGLDFQRLVDYLDNWRVGFFRGAGMAWDLMERRDYQLQITRPKRLKSVARHGYDILIRDDIDDSEQAAAQEQKDFLANFYGNVTATSALNPDEEGNMSLLIRQMMDAVGKYYAVHEIVWVPVRAALAKAPPRRAPGQSQTDPNGDDPAQADDAGPEFDLTAKFIFCPVWWFEGTRGKLRFLPSEFQIYGIDMEPGDWLVTCGDGLMESCSILYLMKAMLLKSNLAFLDKFGMPGIHGETDAQKGTNEWNNFVEAIQDFSQEWATVTNRGAKINLVEAKSNGDAGYQKLLEVFDRAITQLWRGGDLGTKSSQHGAGASLQEDESEILETDDAKMIEETLDAKVTKFALAWKFGPDARQLAYIKLRTTPRRNIQDDLAVDDFLSSFTDNEGEPLLGLQTTLERYSRALPKKGEERLTPNPTAAPQGKNPNKPGTENPPSATDKNPVFANSAEADALKAALRADLDDLLKKLGIENNPKAAAEVLKTVLESLGAQFANDGSLQYNNRRAKRSATGFRIKPNQ